MKSLFICVSLCFVCLPGMAQVSTEPIPISRDSALKFKTIQEVFGLPVSSDISGGTVAVISRRDNITERWKPAKGMADPVIGQMIREARSGDRLVFDGFTAAEGGKRTKLDKKSFRIK